MSKQNRQIIIGTRGSALALWQAEYIAMRLKKELGIESRLQIVKTQGDRMLDVPLAKIGGKGLFTKELEKLLLQEKIDIAVHSLKDVPVEFVEGLDLACITKREDVRDCFLSVRYASILDLPPGARVGTTSLRRSMQLKILRKDLDTQSLRGNVQTRLKRLFDGEFDAIILAQAGLNRLGIDQQKVPFLKPFSTEELIPAMGQGALGIEAREGDGIFSLLQGLNDEATAICTNAERTFIRVLDGGCQVPIGVHAQCNNQDFVIHAILGLPDGSKVLRDSISGNTKDSILLAENLAERFLSQGALEILEQAKEMAFL
ncbi:porphobilinogen deaminase [Helicobacter mustelae]|uniref:hydroxymethylbilane synthase n=1 Tax=Helicobacter mustelae TaxID=217 RepID=UPI000E05D82D|nr:hydroxymethylbilane synthase [Helicobacter mustelae]STP13156.1 porphobilinogen deaminase [Helicobacter mustelae]